MVEEEKQIGDDFLTELLRGTKGRKVEVQMLEETYEEAMRLAAENGWDEAEALLIVFANGLAYLKGERRLDSVAGDEGDLKSALLEMTERCMEMESMYAAMKFRAYYLAEDRRTLELNVTGLRLDNNAMRKRLFEYRSEVEELKAQVERLEQENRQFRAMAADTPSLPGHEHQKRSVSVPDRLTRAIRRIGGS